MLDDTETQAWPRRAPMPPTRKRATKHTVGGRHTRGKETGTNAIHDRMTLQDPVRLRAPVRLRVLMRAFRPC